MIVSEVVDCSLVVISIIVDFGPVIVAGVGDVVVITTL